MTIKVGGDPKPSEDGWERLDAVSMDLIIKASVVNVLPNPISFTNVSSSRSRAR